jgi:RalA-binding protein 1
VDYFFDMILGSQLDDQALFAIAEFLSTDIVQKHDSQRDKRFSLPASTSSRSPTNIEDPVQEGENPAKAGYLTKRGKNFGGWQTRYFVLDGPQLKYYDAVHLWR